MPYRKTLVAGSQHRLFESEPPSAYELSKCRVEPLNLEEFAVWENLSEYSESMRKDMKDEVADLTGFVPRLIGLLFKLARTFVDSIFEEMAQHFKLETYSAIKKRHFEYLDCLNNSKKADSCEMLYKLFVSSEIPTIALFDNAFLDRGLLNTFNNRSLDFYNNIPRDLLLKRSRSFILRQNVLMNYCRG